MSWKTFLFLITQAILTDATEISELVGQLSSEERSSSPILWRTNRIRTIQDTLAISRTTLSIEQLTAVLNGKHMIVPPRDIAEVKNSRNVYESIAELDPYSVDSLLVAHSAMVHDLMDEARLFCSNSVKAADSGGDILHMGTLPRFCRQQWPDWKAVANTAAGGVESDVCLAPGGIDHP